MNLVFNVVLLAIFFITVKSWVLPVEKCHLDDSKCIKTAIQNSVDPFINGIPELGVEKMGDLDDISFDLSGLKFLLKNGHLEFRNIEIDNVDWNLEKKYVDITYHVDCTLKGHYVASGKIIILPIQGDGEMEIVLEYFETKFRMPYDIKKGADGKDYLHPKKASYEFEVKKHASFKMTNLFNGNKELSDNVQKFVNDRWKDITGTFGKPIVDNFMLKTLKNIASFFKKIPVDEFTAA